MESFQGIFLKQIPFKESSKIMHIYTDEGLKSVLIHGAKRLKSPFLASSDLLNEVICHTSGKDLLTLVDMSIVEHYDHIREDVIKTTFAQHICELILHVADSSIDHKRLKPFLSKVLQRINTTDQAVLYVYMFELKLLYLLGVQPSLKQCLICQSSKDLTLSVLDGGARCETHVEHKEAWSEDVRQLASALYYYDITNDITWTIDDALISECRRFLDRYYEVYLNYRTKSRNVWMGLLGY